MTVRQLLRKSSDTEILMETRRRYTGLRKTFESAGLDARPHWRELLTHCQLASIAAYKHNRLALVPLVLVIAPAVGAIVFLFDRTYPEVFGASALGWITIASLILLFLIVLIGLRGLRWSVTTGVTFIFSYVLATGVSGLILSRTGSGAWKPNFNDPATSLTQQIGLGLTLSAIAVVLSILGSALNSVLVQRLREWMYVNRWPVETVFAELTMTMMELREPVKYGSGHLRSRRGLSLRMDRIALCLRFGFPKLLMTGTAGDIETQTRFSAAAQAFESYKVALAIPNDRTVTELQRALAEASLAVATGAYDQLPETDKSTTARGARSARLLSACRTLATGLLPIAALWAARWLDLPLSDAQQSWFVVAAIVWVLLVFVAALDPLLSNRVTTLRDLLGALRGEK